MLNSIFHNVVTFAGDVGAGVRQNETEEISNSEVLIVMSQLPEVVSIVTAIFIVDEYGYKFTYRLPLLGLSAAAVMTLLPVFDSHLPLLTNYLGAAIFGLSGGTALIFLGSLCHVIQHSEAEKLTTNFGRMIAVMLAGRAAGTLLSKNDGVITHGPVVVAILSTVALVASLLCTGYETVKRKDCNPRRDWFHTYERQEVLHLVAIVLILIVHETCVSSEELAARVLVLNPTKLDWSQSQFTTYLVAVLLCQGLGSLLLIPIIVKQFDLSELTAVMIAIACKAISLALTSFAIESWMMYLTLPLQIVDGACLSCLLTILTRLASHKDIRRILCLTFIFRIILESLGSRLTLFTATWLNIKLYNSAFGVLAFAMVSTFAGALWVSGNLKAYKHQTLLENISLTEECESSEDIMANDWLLNACDDEVRCILTEGETNSNAIPPEST
ncbi:uncharacterized protein [Watersipora subatra]|uniref:uncharacterized protein n=1 Tax=Watersipora subatra TaxID=2589382 RepID=UPI00355C732C